MNRNCSSYTMVVTLSVISASKSNCNSIPSPMELLGVLRKQTSNDFKILQIVTANDQNRKWHCFKPAAVKPKCIVFLHCLSYSFSLVKVKQASMCETSKKSRPFIKTDSKRMKAPFSLTSENTGSLCFLTPH